MPFELNSGMTDPDTTHMRLKTVDDEAGLLARLRNGDEEAYEELVCKYIGRILSVVRRLVGHEEDANDAVQEAFLAAFKAIDRFDGKSRLGTWLHRIAVNAALMKLRSKRSRREQSIEELLPAFLGDGHQSSPCQRWSETAESVLARQEARAHIQECVRRLPEDFRDVLLLRDIEELSNDETAELLGISLVVLKTRLHRARQALRTLLEPYVEGAAS